MKSYLYELKNINNIANADNIKLCPSILYKLKHVSNDLEGLLNLYL